MKKQGIVIAVVALLLLAVGSVLISRHRANAKADAIMRPTFQQGWFRDKTHPILWLNGNWQPYWSIQYEMDHPTAIGDFGPQFMISWSGKLIMMSPDDLEERIKKNAETVEQPLAQVFLIPRAE